MQQTVKKHATPGITGFELVDYLLQNVNKWELSHVTQLVLFQIAKCYNPKNKYMFPKQKTLALKTNSTERSVIRAIQSLVNKGLIIVECNGSNRYLFAPRILAEAAQMKKNFCSENMSDNTEIISQSTDIISPTLIEQIKEQKKEPLKVEDFKILKAYAQKMKAGNINAYINKLISNGSAKEIIKESKRTLANARAMENNTKQVINDLKFAQANRAGEIPQVWFDMKKILLQNITK